MTDYNSVQHKGVKPKDNKPSTVSKKEVDDEIKELKLKGSITTKKKPLVFRVFNTLLGKEALKRTGTYLIKDVIMPALQDTAYNTLMTGGKMLIYKDKTYNAPTQSYGRSRGSNKTHYNTMYSFSNDNQAEENYAPGDSYEDVLEIEFTSPEDANYVLNEMASVIRRRGAISVSEYYGLIDSTIVTTYVMRTYGWDNINQAVVRRASSGKYIIDLPEPIDLQL